MNNISIENLLSFLGGKNVSYTFEGDHHLHLNRIAPISTTDEKVLCFWRNNNGCSELLNNKNICILVDRNYRESLHENISYIFVDNPEYWFCEIANELFGDAEYPAQWNFVSPDAKISKHAIIGKNCHIEDGVKIAEFCVIENAYISKNTKISAGTKIGASGLGSVYNETNQRMVQFPHIGTVTIGQNCIVQDNTVIHRGNLDDTIISANVHIGPLSWIGHNAKIGSFTIISQNVTIAGSAEIGEHCRIWGNASIRDGVKLGNRVIVGMGAAVINDISDGKFVKGIPAI